LGVHPFQEAGECIQGTGWSGWAQSAHGNAVALDEDGLARLRPLEELGETRPGLGLGNSSQHGAAYPPLWRVPQAAGSQEGRGRPQVVLSGGWTAPCAEVIAVQNPRSREGAHADPTSGDGRAARPARDPGRMGRRPAGTLSE